MSENLQPSSVATKEDIYRLESKIIQAKLEILECIIIWVMMALFGFLIGLYV